jgi:hypothetical protein
MGGLFGLSSASSSSGFDFSVLNDYYLAKSQARSATSAPVRKSEPVSVKYAPWLQTNPLTTNTARLRDALSASSFVDLRDSDINKAGVDADHKKLFAVYKGLTRLQALAERSATETAVSGERASLNKRFQAGMTEIRSFLNDKGFEDLTLSFGEKTSKVDTAYRKARTPSVYNAPSIVTGQSTDAISGLLGTESFNVTIAKSGGNQTIAMNLSEISGTVSIDSLISYMNGKLEAAGVYTRFSKTTVNGAKDTDPKRIGLAIQTVATERVGFEAATTKAAVYVGAIAGGAANKTGQVTKLTDDATSSVSNFTKKVTATGGVSEVKGTATDAEGNVFVVGSATEAVAAGIVQGSQDVFLRKYDSAGQLVWSRLLGASQSASGYAVAVDANGNVAIAGRVSEKLSSTAVGGGEDSFVAKYDAEGREVFMRQISPVSDDTANALAFASDGSLLVAGQTKSAMSSSVAHNGGTDAYLMKLSTTGSLNWVRHFGGTGDDRATSVGIASDGSAVVATVENGEAVVRKVGIADGTSDPVWSVNLGSLGQGSLGAVSVDGSAIYVAGSTTNTSLNAGGQASIVSAHAGGSDGFVTRINDAGSSGTAAFTTYVGTAGQESGLGLVASNGSVYIAGSTSGDLSGTSSSANADAYVRKLDSSGNTVWTQQFENAAGASVATSLSVDPQGASVLDVLGLPRGKVAFDEARTITAGSSVRAGDHFFIRVNEGSKFKVTIDSGETMRSLARKINNVLLLKGSAEVSRTGGDGVKISAGEQNVVELLPGSKGFDALAGLGLEPIKLDATRKTASTAASVRTFALGLKTDLAIDEKLKANTLTYQLGAAIEVIKTAYMAITGTTMSAGSGLDQRALASYKSALGALGR